MSEGKTEEDEQLLRAGGGEEVGEEGAMTS